MKAAIMAAALRASHRWISAGAAVCVGSTILVVTASAQPVAEIPKQTADGLELRQGRPSGEGMAIVYVRPGATLAAYRRVMLDPVEVTFDPSRARPAGMSAKDRERIRRELAEEFRIVFTEVLEQNSGYEVVRAAGPDVLRVTAEIVDLYVAPPGVATSERSGTYVVSAGRMSLIAELHDAGSDAILARVIDRQAAATPGRMPGVLQWTTRSSNRAEARRVLRTWADRLRVALDSARDVTTR